MPSSAPLISILIVDDHAENIVALRAILASPDYRLVTATTGAEALKRVLREDFAVILLDVVMPDIDGFEVAALIKKRERSRHIPIIFLTAGSKDIASIYKGYSVGAVDYLLKPLEAEVVRAKVAVFVELHRRGEQIRRQTVLLREAEQRRRELELEDLRRLTETRYRNLADAIPQCVWTARPDGAVEYVNERWLTYTGLGLQASLGWGWQAAIHPNDVERFVAHWRHSLEAGEPLRMECRLRAAHGGYRWHLCQALPERGPARNVVAWLGTFTDVNDERRLEEERRELLARERAARIDAETAQRRSEFLAEASSELAMLLDEESVVAAVARLAAQQICTWCIVDLVDPDGTPRLAAFHHQTPGSEAAVRLAERRPLAPDAAGIGAVLATGRPHLLDACDAVCVTEALGLADTEVAALLGAGSFLSVPLVARGRVLGAMSLVLVGRDGGFAPADLAVALDLAQRAALCLDNARLYCAEREAVRLRDDFLSVASHELRTPISALVLQLQTLIRAVNRPGDAPSSERWAVMLTRAERQTSRLTRLVNQLLDVTRIHSGRLDIEREDVDLREVVHEVGARFEAELPGAGCTLQIHAGDEVIGRWDRLRIDQVLTNLLQNAIKYGAGKAIEISVGIRGESARIEVVDHGIGIPTEHVQRIFGRFERAVSARSYGGLGLGLFIVDQIVTAHGGTIHVESAPDRGSRFIVELPLLPLEPVVQRRDRQPGSSEPPQHASA